MSKPGLLEVMCAACEGAVDETITGAFSIGLG